MRAASMMYSRLAEYRSSTVPDLIAGNRGGGGDGVAANDPAVVARVTVATRLKIAMMRAAVPV
jgi:hypothetical protein